MGAVIHSTSPIIKRLPNRLGGSGCHRPVQGREGSKLKPQRFTLLVPMLRPGPD